MQIKQAAKRILTWVVLWGLIVRIWIPLYDSLNRLWVKVTFDRYQESPAVVTEVYVLDKWVRPKRQAFGYHEYALEINYTYTVNARRYVADNWITRTWTRDKDKNELQSQDYPSGKAITIFYDPKDPRRSTIQAITQSRMDYLWLSLTILSGVLLGLFGLAVMLYGPGRDGPDRPGYVVAQLHFDPVPPTPVPVETSEPPQQLGKWSLKYHPAQGIHIYYGDLIVMTNQLVFQPRMAVEPFVTGHKMDSQDQWRLPLVAICRLERLKKYGILSRLRITLADNSTYVFERGLFLSVQPIMRQIAAAIQNLQ